jgi:hypothetical protein
LGEAPDGPLVGPCSYLIGPDRKAAATLALCVSLVGLPRSQPGRDLVSDDVSWLLVLHSLALTLTQQYCLAPLDPTPWPGPVVACRSCEDESEENYVAARLHQLPRSSGELRGQIKAELVRAQSGCNPQQYALAWPCAPLLDSLALTVALACCRWQGQHHACRSRRSVMTGRWSTSAAGHAGVARGTAARWGIREARQVGGQGSQALASWSGRSGQAAGQAGRGAFSLEQSLGVGKMQVGQIQVGQMGCVPVAAGQRGF